MSTPPKPPERLAEILLEILALSDSERPSPLESVSDSNPIESSDSHCAKAQSRRIDGEENNARTP